MSDNYFDDSKSESSDYFDDISTSESDAPLSDIDVHDYIYLIVEEDGSRDGDFNDILKRLSNINIIYSKHFIY